MFEQMSFVLDFKASPPPGPFKFADQTIQDTPIWGHPDIVSASISEDFRRAIPDTADIRRGP